MTMALDKKTSVRMSRIERIYKKAGHEMPSLKRWGQFEHVPSYRTNRDPWKTENVASKLWPIHAPELFEIKLDVVAQMADDGGKVPEYELARAILQDSSQHMTCKNATDIAPRSSITRKHAEELVRKKICRKIEEEEVLNWGLVRLSPEETKTRNRIISDMLFENAYLDETRKVAFSPMEYMMHRVGASSWAVSFDFSGWYYQLPLSPAVQRHMAYKVGNEWYCFVRSVMGHKHNVFMAHTITTIIAQFPPEWKGAIHSDIIIDNVIMYGQSKDTVAAAARWFVARCALCGAQLGPYNLEPTQSPTHRGVRFDLANHTFHIKPDWITKLDKRVKFCLSDNRATVDHFTSIAGMFAYGRVVLRYSADDYIFWRFVAKLAQKQGNSRVVMPPSVSRCLQAMSSDVQRNTPRKAGVPLKPLKFLIATDASQTRPFAGWGAVLLGSDGRIDIISGIFSIQMAMACHINELEMRAALMAMDHWKVKVQFNKVEFLMDNTVAVAILNLGRSATWNLNSVSRHFRDLSNLHTIEFHCTWIPTTENPADALSRGKAFSDQDEHGIRSLGASFGMDAWRLTCT